MQVVARLMDRVLAARNARVTVVGATSGDTGGAAIEAFRGSKRVDAIMLFPNGRVSDVQRRMMTTATEANVHAVAVDGTFDDCQALLKAMFNDMAFRDRVKLAGVNSINWARVVAQITYYFVAAAALGGPHRPMSFSVPTGNFGDIFAGYAAKRMGLPIERLVIATNDNDILRRTHATGTYEVRGVMATTSPSMDIQVSSNFERYLFEASNRDAAWVRGKMGALVQSGRFDLSDAVLAAMRAEFDAATATRRRGRRLHPAGASESGYLLDPHTACGVVAAEKVLATRQGTQHRAGDRPSREVSRCHRGDHRRAPPLPPPPRLAAHGPGTHHGAAQRSRRRSTFRLRARWRQPGSRRMSRHETQLANGLRVVSHRMPNLETVSMGIWVGVGARHETVDAAGHFASAGAYGLQGHQAAQRQGYRRGNRGGGR